MGGRHNASRKVKEALRNMARVQKRPSSKLNVFLAQNRVGLKPIPYSKFSTPGQKVVVSPYKTRQVWSGATVDQAIKLTRKLARGPDSRHKNIPDPGKVGKATRAFKR